MKAKPSLRSVGVDVRHEVEAERCRRGVNLMHINVGTQQAAIAETLALGPFPVNGGAGVASVHLDKWV